MLITSSADELPSILAVEFSAIRDSITRLSKIGMAIRSASRLSIATRARSFFLQQPHVAGLQRFERRAYLALTHLYPRAPDGLIHHLCESMTDRYAKLRYEVHRAKHNAGDGRGVEVNKMRIQWLLSGDDESAQASTQGFPVSSMDSNGLPEILSAASTTTSQSETITEHTFRSREPPLPKYDGKYHTTCEYCKQVVDLSLLRPNEHSRVEWSNKGR